MEMKIDFPGGQRVDAHYKGFTIRTDQPESEDGEDSAPSPFDLFLASLGTCTGYYVLSFCRKRSLDIRGIELTLATTRDEEKHMLSEISIDVRLPHDFPERYIAAVGKAASQCTVKKHLFDPPSIKIEAHRGEERDDG